MKQAGLCVMRDSGFDFHSTDTYSMVDEKLRELFPRLFDWLCDTEPYDAETSSWLICMKPSYSRKSLVVFSDDQALPTGFDIRTACQLAKGKVGHSHRILYLGKLIYIIHLLCYINSSIYFSYSGACSKAGSSRVETHCHWIDFQEC